MGKNLEKVATRAVLSSITRAYLKTLEGQWGRFVQSAKYPQRAQDSRLSALLGLGENSDFGRQHGFSKIDSLASFRSRVPIRDYEEFSPWIDRICRGEKNVLTSSPVKMVELSGGSSQTNKYIPYTDVLLEEISAATSPWIYDLYTSMPELKGTTSYWSVSPVMQADSVTEGGLPIGFEDDTEYFGPLTRWALRQLMAVPATVARIQDLRRWRLTTLKYLLEAEDLGFISIWSPSFLTLLMETLDSHIESLLGQIRPARAGFIAKGIERAGGRLIGELIWPRLKAISCWTDGWASNHLPALKKWFPSTQIQPKGLLATEGVVSFPITGNDGSVLAVGGHFMEFIDLENPDAEALLAHQLREGGSYSPVLTTGGGLYRYHLKDVIRCVGFYLGTPLIRFEGKLDSVSDICGEKLNVGQIDRALDQAKMETGLDYRFAIISPAGEPKPSYCLFIETDNVDQIVENAVLVIERKLCESHHYRYCRKLGQLGPLRAVRVENGWATYADTAISQGRRAGSFKPIALDVHGLAVGSFSEDRMIEISEAALKELMS